MMDLAFATLDATNTQRPAAALMMEVLRSEGVRYIFGNPGTTEMPLVNALNETQGIAYVLGLQEASVVAMADGYATVAGRPGFVNIHTAGGLGHAMGALLHSRIANTPLVITAGRPDTRHAPMDPLLGGDAVEISRPVVKWAREVTHPDHLPMLLRRAFNDSVTVPQGPVFLSLPMDIMQGTTSVTAGQKLRIHRGPVATGLDELSDALVSIKHLAIIAGDEVSSAHAHAETIELAEALSAPVFGSSWPGAQSFPATHALWNGSLPTRASEIRACLERFDAVLVLGGHSLIAYAYSEGPALPPTCRLLQMSADANNLGRIFPTTWSSVGDIKASLRALLPDLHRKLEPHRSGIALLRERAVQVRAGRHEALIKHVRSEMKAGATTPLIAAHEVLRGAGSRATIVDESPVTMEFVRSCLRLCSPRRYLFMRSAILGWGMPAAVGVSLGLDREPVIALVGDGSSLYSPQALWTAARERLPVTFVVMNNRKYGILKSYQQNPQPGASRPGALDLVNPTIDFSALAASMGLPAVRIEHPADIAGAVEARVGSNGPSLIEIPLAD